MKKLLIAVLAVFLFVGCSSGSSASDSNNDTEDKADNGRIQGGTPLLDIVPVRDGDVIESKFDFNKNQINEQGLVYTIVDRLDTKGYGTGYSYRSFEDNDGQIIFLMVEVKNTSKQTLELFGGRISLYVEGQQINSSDFNMPEHSFSKKELKPGESFTGIVEFSIKKDKANTDIEFAINDKKMSLSN